MLLKLGKLGSGIGSKKVPFASDAVEIWDGTIIDVAGTKYLEGKKGVGNLLITNYDFDTYWTSWSKGIPYKTAATLSAPAGNATLIAADVNNFFYDSGGTPNQIPVTSFFQNVDYANKLFCKHKDQQVVSVPIETHIKGVYVDYDMEVYERRVLEIVLYANAKTGTDLTKCNSYYNVPLKQTSNMREVGAGKTYSTINSAISAASAGDRIYIYSGKYVENINNSKNNLTFYGLGNVVIQPTASQTYTLINSGTNAVFNGLYIIPNTTTTGFMNTGSGLTVNKCYFPKVSNNRTFWYRGAGSIIIDNSVFLGGYEISNSITGDINVSCSYFTNTYDQLMLIGTPSVASSATNIIKHCKLVNNVGTNTISNHGNNVLVLDNTFIYNTFYSITSHVYASPDTYEVVLNQVTANSGHCYHNYTKFSNNNITISGLGAGTENRIYSGNYKASHTNVLFSNNNISCPKPFVQILSMAANTDAYTLYLLNNNIHSTHTTGGNEVYAVYLGNLGVINNWNAYIDNNKIIVDGPAHTCLYLNAMKSFDVRRNYFKGNGTYMVSCIVSKSSLASAVDATMANICYNKLHETGTGRSMIFKGINNIKFYGNTCIKGKADNTDKAVITAIDSENGAKTTELTIKNNIIIGEQNVEMFANNSSTSGDNYIINNNIYYSGIGAIKLTWKQVEKTFSEWKALGFDVNSVEQNPQLSNNSIPASKLEHAENLGTDYGDGLDVSTNWGDEDTLPVVVTRQQGETWQNGAYILE